MESVGTGEGKWLRFFSRGNLDGGDGGGGRIGKEVNRITNIRRGCLVLDVTSTLG